MKNRGYLIETDTGEAATVYHKDQKAEFEAMEKVLITVIRNQKTVKILKSKEKIKLTGFTD